MYVLIVTRKGVVERVAAGSSYEALKGRAATLDGSPAGLNWQDFYSHIGAPSEHDGEKTYAIHSADVV